LLTKLAVYPLAFAASVVVDRTLGAHERGLYAFLLLVGNFILPLLTFGFGGAVIFYLSAGKRTTSDVGFTSLLVGLGQGTLTGLLAYALWRAGWLGATGRETRWGELWPMLSIAPLQGLQLMAGRILFGESRFGVSNWLSIARAILNPMLLLILVVAVKLGLAGAVWATVILNVVLTVAYLAVLMPSGLRLRYDHSFFVEGMRYGLKMWIGDIATRANLRLDQLLLGIFASASALGNYSVAVRMSEVLWMGADSVSPVLFNRMAAAKDDQARIEMAGRVHRIGLVMMIVIAIAAGIGGWWMIPIIFGSQFAEAALIFELLLPGTVALFTAKVLTKYFAAVGRPELSGRLGLWSSMAGAALYFSLIPVGATTGAAIASSASYVLMSVIAIVLYRRVIAPHEARLFAPEKADIHWLRKLIAK